MLRIIQRILVALVALVLAIVAFVYARSEYALRTHVRVDEAALAIPTDADAIARGEHIAITRGCTDCHTADLGGKVNMEVPAIGRMAASNLTRGNGGVPADFSDADYERAIRHGLKADGTALLFMPSRDFAALTDADVADLIAYIKSRPAVDRKNVPSYIGPLGRALFAFGVLPMVESRLVDHAAPHAPRVDAGATADYGRYLARACVGCHGEHLSGGPIPGVPPSFKAPANITPDASGLAGWTRDDFHRVFREGKKRDGSAIDEFMPWQALGHFSDMELDALWAYLQTVPPRALGQR
ncbi:MAG: c-type cytochrome [Rhodanobacteraceae bacterium]